MQKCFIVLFVIKKQYIFQNKGDSERISSTLHGNNMDSEEEEEEEDDDQEEKNEDNAKEEEDKEDANVHKSECKKSIPYEDEMDDNTTNDDKSCIMESVNQETRKPNVTDDKKRKKDNKTEKSKNIKRQYDQDVHSEDYSTWVPPRDQSGDGRTNLNDKYGY